MRGEAQLGSRNGFERTFACGIIAVRRICCLLDEDCWKWGRREGEEAGD